MPALCFVPPIACCVAAQPLFCANHRCPALVDSRKVIVRTPIHPPLVPPAPSTRTFAGAVTGWFVVWRQSCPSGRDRPPRRHYRLAIVASPPRCAGSAGPVVAHVRAADPVGFRRVRMANPAACHKIHKCTENSPPKTRKEIIRCLTSRLATRKPCEATAPNRQTVSASRQKLRAAFTTKPSVMSLTRAPPDSAEGAPNLVRRFALCGRGNLAVWRQSAVLPRCALHERWRGKRGCRVTDD